MGYCAQRPKRRRVKIVGGGFRHTREPNGVQGGSMKAGRRAKRKLEKSHKKRSKSS